RSAAADRDLGRGPRYCDAFGVGARTGQAHRAVDAVEGEAALEEVAEVQGQAPRQLRDAEQAEHAARAGLDLGELAVARVELEREIQREQREAGRAARPCGVEGGGPTAAVELAAVAQAAEQGTEI